MKDNELPNGLELNTLVSYYNEGWRTGLLVSVSNSKAKVRPASAYKAGPAHLVSVNIYDCKRIEK